MYSLNERIIVTLMQTEVKDLSHLIRFMRDEKGFFWVQSAGHDHWTNGTAQHSWRVYQYMRYLWEHPEKISNNNDPQLTPAKVKAVTEQEIILAGLLHDVGKMWGCNHHASKSKEILDEKLGTGFSKRYRRVVAAIFFHHNASKDGGDLNSYRHSTLKKLLNIADSMAAGTTWNSTRFKEHESQKHRVKSDVKHLRRVAMDRTCQMLNYRMYLDHHYDFHTIGGYNWDNIQWNAQEDLVAQIKAGTASFMGREPKTDFITAAHQQVLKNQGGKVCLAIGVKLSVSDKEERNLRQDNPQEEELLICSNLLLSCYSSKNIGKFRFAYTMRDAISGNYQQQNPDKGIFLPDVTFIRDGVSEGFQQVAPWMCDVLLVPNWKGAEIIELHALVDEKNRNLCKIRQCSMWEKMKCLGKRNLQDDSLILVYNILGYNVYVPNSYFNPLSFLKQGCPIWINYGEDGVCDVYECNNDDQDITYMNVVEIIKHFPPRHGFYCQPISDGETYEKGTIITGAKCLDENEHTLATIIICEDSNLSELKGIPCGKITILENLNDDALHELAKFLFRIYNIDRHRSLLVSYVPKNEKDAKNAQMISMVKKDDGIYYYQFE